MSTNSCVILKVRKQDIGKNIMFDESLLPVKLKDWRLEDIDGKIWRDESGKNLCEPIVINSQYIGIYCHWDGYLNGVGKCLLKNFKNYNQVLDLIVGGDCVSIIRDEVRHFANRNEEKWEHIAPEQNNNKLELVDNFVGRWAEYAYVFDENKGGWFYSTLYRNKKVKFKQLTEAEILKNH